MKNEIECLFQDKWYAFLKMIKVMVSSIHTFFYENWPNVYFFVNKLFCSEVVKQLKPIITFFFRLTSREN